MIKHIVMWTLHENAQGKSKAENAAIICKELMKLPASIPQIVRFETGINAPDAPVGNWDVVLVSEFATLNDLLAYQVHPEHVAFKEFIAPLRKEKASVDYEY